MPSSLVFIFVGLQALNYSVRYLVPVQTFRGKEQPGGASAVTEWQRRAEPRTTGAGPTVPPQLR